MNYIIIMCGIFGIFNNDNKDTIINDMIEGIKSLQHRGQDAHGISYKLKDKQNINTMKYLGMVKTDNFTDIINTKYITSCIGHTKYSTSSKINNFKKVSSEEIQPISNKEISIVHNGNIPNVKGFDTEFLMKRIINYNGSFSDSLINIVNTIPAAFCLLIIYKNDLFIIRDRYGIRPLSYGYKNNNVVISSESISLNGCINISDVLPGEIIRINSNGLRQIYNHPDSKDCFCSFELFYFMNPYSYYNKKLVKQYREELANKLAKKEDIIPVKSDYIVIGIPSSGIIYGMEYAKHMCLNYKQLIQKKTSERTFIGVNKEEREKICNDKFVFHKTGISGENIIIVDDTIVRGNVMKNIINNLKLCGANEIHVRIPSPPVIDRCQLGIDINKEDLIMNNKSIHEVESIFEINSLKYLILKDLSNFPKHSYKECFGELDKKIIFDNE